MTNVTNLEQAAEKLARKSKPPAATKTGTGGFDSTGRRVIRHDGGREPEILDQLAEALSESAVDLFTHAGRLVRIHPAPTSHAKGIERATGAPILHPVDSYHLCEIAGRVARHERYDGRSDRYKPIDFPQRGANAYLSRGHWPEIRPLVAFSESPLVTLSGRLIDLPGYDQQTGLYLAYKEIVGYASPPAKPTMDQAVDAAARILAPFEKFPFVAPADKSACLAGVLTCIERRILPGAPMFGITAPAPRTGKSLVGESYAVIATGRRATCLSVARDEAETEKRLTGMLLAGDAAALLDNVEVPLGGALLCQMATQQTARVRPLGGSGLVSAPTNCFLSSTGNNLLIVGDLKHRTCLVRLDSGVERPEHRVFSNDHLEDMLSHRGQIIRDALTIVLAYLAAGCPAVDGIRPLGGFEQWDRLVRRPLVWLGLQDPMTASDTLLDQDPDLEATRLLFGAWHDVFKSEPKTAAEVVEAATSEYANQDLREALLLVCRQKPSAASLGYWLRNHRDRIVDGRTLKKEISAAGVERIKRWFVVSAAPSQGEKDALLPF